MRSRTTLFREFIVSSQAVSGRWDCHHGQLPSPGSDEFGGEQKVLREQRPAARSCHVNCAFLAGGSCLGACPGLHACRGRGAEGKWWGLLPSQGEAAASPDREEARQEATSEEAAAAGAPSPSKDRAPGTPRPPPTTGSPIFRPVQPGTIPHGWAGPLGWRGEPHRLQERLVPWPESPGAAEQQRGREVWGGVGSRALPLQLLVRLIFNEAAEHGEGSERSVRGHHVAGSLRETGSSRSVPAVGLPAARPAPRSDCSTRAWRASLRHGQQPCPHLLEPPQPYLDGEEGDVGKFLHEAPDLVLASFRVEPGPASHLHLGPAAAPSVPRLPEAGGQPSPCPCRSQPRHAADCTARSWWPAGPGPAHLPSGTGSPQTTRPRGSCRPCRRLRCTPGSGISAGQEESERFAGQRPWPGRRPVWQSRSQGPMGSPARTVAPSSFRYWSFICMYRRL